VRDEQESIRNYVEDVEDVATTLKPGVVNRAARQAQFEELIDRLQHTGDPIHKQMAQVMVSFLAGLFVGEGLFEEIKDNLDLERWFRLPKSHERRIHGHRHAGVRIVLEGPTLARIIQTGANKEASGCV
jgi:site-specific recombinase